MGIVKIEMNRITKVEDDCYSYRAGFTGVYKNLLEYAEDSTLPVILRLLSSELLDNKGIIFNTIKDVSTLDINMCLDQDIQTHHILTLLMYAVKIAEHDTAVVEELATKNTVFRGYSVYQLVQTLSKGFYNNSVPGVSKVYSRKHLTPSSHVAVVALRAFFEGNKEVVINYFVPTLQLFLYHKILTPEICEEAQHIAEENTNIRGDIADFFVNSIDEQRHEFQRFRIYGLRYTMREGNDGPINHSQNAHLLDSKRSKLIEWIVNKTENFNRTDDTENEEILHYIKTLRNSGNINIVKATNRIYDDNTNLVYIQNGNKSKLTFQEIFMRVVHFIINHEESEFLKKRLQEELKDAGGTCFSGHFNRLFNTFSGLEDISIVDIEGEFKRKLRGSLQLICADAPEEIEIMDIFIDGGSREAIVYVKSVVDILKENLQFEYKSELTTSQFNQVFNTVVNDFFGVNLV